jgi:hypothetical protein
MSSNDENADKGSSSDAENNAEHDAKGGEKPSVEYDAGLGDSERVMKDNSAEKPGRVKRFFRGYWRKKKWTLPLTLLAIIAIVFIVPATRYKVLGLWVKSSFAVTVVDSKTNTPVSGATVSIDGKRAVTNSTGRASVTVKVGNRAMTVNKKYYEQFSRQVFVGIKGQQLTQVKLVATGRQVPIKVVNKISGNPVVNAEVKVLDTSTKTDSDGKAIIVLPTTEPTQSASITASGYNDLSAKIQVTSNAAPGNTFKITPSGRVYFLSNLSGNIGVVSTNLDGTDRQTVLAGTGSEDLNNTVLLASRDWKYLALLSKRDGGQNAKLFLINTSAGNQLTTIDASSASIAPVGWDGHYFVYRADQANGHAWQSNQSALKSFNADTGSTATLDQTSAFGNSIAYAGQDFGYGDTYITSANNDVVYIKEWSDNGAGLTGKQDQILSIAPNGTGKQVLKQLSLPSDGSYQTIGSVAYKPNDIYYQVSNISGSTYYEYASGSITQSNTITGNLYNQYQQDYSTYLLSPSGNQTFWADQRDGKNTLFVGAAGGSNGNQIASLSDYTSYGWYTDNYLLVEKGGSELYVMPVAGPSVDSSSNGKALKISDYYKPPQNFYGYGGGYGGL